MSDRFSLVRWRDAKADPPEDGVKVLTSRGLDAPWYEQPPYTSDPDYLWCDPSPPGDDALTLKDLQRAHDALLYASGNLDHGILTVVYPEECDASATRLRRAIEEVGES